MTYLGIKPRAPNLWQALKAIEPINLSRGKGLSRPADGSPSEHTALDKQARQQRRVEQGPTQGSFLRHIIAKTMYEMREVGKDTHTECFRSHCLRSKEASSDQE